MSKHIRPFLRYVTDPDEGGGEQKQDEKPTETVGQGDLEKALADVEKWKALSRKNEQQAKENAEKARKFDEAEEANKTELEKALARAEAAEKAIAEREAKDQAAALAQEIAKEKGIADASVLRGSTKEELEAHADQLLSLLPKPTGAAPADGQGKTGRIGAPKQITNRDQLRNMTPQEIEQARKEGQLDGLLGVTTK